MIHGLFATITNVNFDDDSIRSLIQTVHAEKEKLSPNCSSCANPCQRSDESTT